jgi:hypothetical protein
MKSTLHETTISIAHSNGEVAGRLFNEQRSLHDLKHYLPSQQALRDFIHHNSLHAFQHMKFYDAIFKGIKNFRVPGAPATQ